MKKVLHYILLIFLLIIGFFLRSKMFLSGDFYYLSDQGRDMQLIKTIVFDHKMTLIGGHAGIGGLFHGPLYWYILSFFSLFSKGDPFWTLIPVYELVSLGMIIAGYFIASKLYGRVTGFLVAFLMTFSHTFIETIQFTSNSQVMPLIFLLYIFTILMYLRGKDMYIAISLFLIGLGIQFEAAFSIMLIPITLFAFIYRRKMPKMKYVMMGILLFVISVSNFVLFDIRHQFLMLHTVLNILTGHLKPNKADVIYTNLLYRLNDRLAWFFFTFKSVIYSDTLLMVILLLCVIFGAVVFYFIRSKTQTKSSVNEALFLFAFIIIAFVGYCLYPLGLQAHYVQSLAIAAIFITALCMNQLIQHKVGLVVTALFCLLTVFLATNTLWQTYVIQPRYTPTSDGSYKLQLAAVDFVYKDAQSKPFGYFAYDAPIVTYGIDYLMWWRGERTYHYIAQSQKLPITYLIMLPGPAGDLHAHDFWEKYTVKTAGKVLHEEVLNGNIIIQKLAIDPSEGPANPNYYQNLIFR